MGPHSDVVVWALRLVRERVDSTEAARCRADEKFSERRVHRLRTQARRLRAALEDLYECIPSADDLMERSRAVGDETGKVRDATVLIEKLERYHRFSFFEERAEIEKLQRVLKKRRRKCERPAKDAIESVTFELKP